MTESRQADAEVAGRADFDFLRGSWTVLSRRLDSPLDELSDEWREFTMEVTNEPILGGLGNIDRYRSAEFPGSLNLAQPAYIRPHLRRPNSLATRPVQALH